MFKSSIDQCHYIAAQAEKVFAKLDDSHRAVEPMPGLKTAGWLIGHLCVTGDFARYMCGAKGICPREWRGMFSPGTHPSHDAATYPPMSQLIDTFRAVYTDLPKTATSADPSVLAKENPYEATRPAFQTAGDFVAYLMSPHMAQHVGELMTWQRVNSAS